MVSSFINSHIYICTLYKLHMFINIHRCYCMINLPLNLDVHTPYYTFIDSFTHKQAIINIFTNDK